MTPDVPLIITVIQVLLNLANFNSVANSNLKMAVPDFPGSMSTNSSLSIPVTLEGNKVISSFK